jgi:transcriptional regulator with XRE-family HTH domain
MNNKNIDSIIDNLFVSESSPPLTDKVVDAYLNTCNEYPPERVQSMRSRFVEKALADLHRGPVKEIKEQISFGRWIKETRKQARLSQKDISTSLYEDINYIDNIENNLVLPWQSNSENIAKLVILFRIHFDALVALFRASFAISQNRDKLGLAARTNKTGDKAKAQDAIKKALEIHFSNKDIRLELSDEVKDFLDLLKNELEQKGAFNLIT